MSTNFIRTCTALATFAGVSCWTQAVIVDLLPLQKGYVVATCFSSTSAYQFTQDPNGFVVAITDASAAELAGAPLSIPGGTHNWRRFHNEIAVQNPGVGTAAREWRASNLGEVFGLTMDDANPPNIYVTATTAYFAQPYPAGNGPGTVYRLSGVDGSITPFNCIPNTGAALGNICFSRAGANGYLYVSSLDDGLIYRLDASGQCVDTYNHGMAGRTAQSLGPIPDTPSTPYTPYGRRVWGVQVHQGRLYYGVWHNLGTAQQIWSVALGASGNFLPGSAIIEIASIPPASGTSSLPVSDISFSASGAMVFAERYHKGAAFGNEHMGRILEYTGSSGSWAASPVNKYKVGNYGTGLNSAGGVDVECTGAVWASGDALNFAWPNFIYGLQRIPAAGNATDTPATANSYLIDLDDYVASVLKGFQGDVEIYDPCAERKCLELSNVRVDCPKEKGGSFPLSFQVTNLSTNTASYIWLTPCPAADLPAGAVTTQPQPAGPVPLVPPLAPGATTSVPLNFALNGVTGSTNVCFSVTLLNDSGDICCTEKVCVQTPECDCFLVRDQKLECKVQADGSVQYTLTLTIHNVSLFPWYYANLLPPGTFNPATFDLTSNPVPPGGNITLTSVVAGVAGQELCFTVSVHNLDIEECCSRKICVVLPECAGQATPDFCEVTRVAACCPDAAVPGSGTAAITLTICNNSPVVRTYDWDIAGLLPVPPCTWQIPDAFFNPTSGTITVPPNSCQSVVIHVPCEGLKPGECAEFETCVKETANPQNRFCCKGRIRQAKQGEPLVKGPEGEPQKLVVDQPGAVRFEVSNPSSSPLDFSYGAWSLPPVLRFGADANPPPALLTTLQRGVLRVAPGRTEVLTLSATPDAGLRGMTAVLPVLLAGVGPDGTPLEPLGSTLVQVNSPARTLFAIRSVARREDGQIAIAVSTVSGKRYRLERCETLTSGGSWQTALSTAGESRHVESFLGNGSVMECLVPATQSGFYRAVELE